MEQWVGINKKADFKAIGEKYGIDQVTARVIRNRDVIEDDDIRKFLKGNLDDLYDPHLFKDGEKLAEILAGKIKDGRKIRIIGDYDIDGVMSTFILNSALLRCGADVSSVIPDRIVDGYGLNMRLINQASEDGIDTIITCDNGIAAIDEIARAKELGMTVLVTDHHAIPYKEEQGEKIYLESKADAIVNPHQKDCNYPFEEICGATVAWKCVFLIYEAMGIDPDEAFEFLENVAFATVGDIMPLCDENRILVKEGLKRIHKTKNIGMNALIRQCGIDKESVDCYHFGFVLGPCVNASGRLDTAKRPLELFMTDDVKRANEIACELVTLNDERKALTLEGVEQAIEIYEQNDYDKDKVIVIYLPKVHESIAGIIAGRVKEKYNKPTFILTKGEHGAKGSGRSIEAYSMYDEMVKCADLFEHFGGHPMAAGLSLPEDKIDEFRERMNLNATLTEADFIPKIKIDVPMPTHYASMDLTRELELLAPFGNKNPRPLFMDDCVYVSRMWIIGKNQNVLRLTLKTKIGTVVSGIYFGDIDAFMKYMKDTYGEAELEKALAGKDNRLCIKIVYAPKINYFRDSESLQFEIKHYR